MVELLSPSGKGLLQQHHHRLGDGIRSVVFGVRDLDQVKGYFRERDITLVAGDRADVLAIPAEHNRGILFEFSA